MPSQVTWGRGIRLAPYAPALAEHRAAVIALVDTRSARLYRYDEGALEDLHKLHSHGLHVGPITRARGAAPSRFHSGVRGMTGADEADRVLRSSSARFFSSLAERLLELAGDDEWIIVGGAPQSAKGVGREFPDRVRDRVRVLSSLPHSATEPEIIRAVSHEVGLLQRERDAALVAQAIDQAATGGKGAAGLAHTREALRDRGVRELFLSEEFIARHTDDAERAIEAAIEQDALVEVVTDEAAQRLDAACEGVAAQLRFPRVQA
jgi:stalled ribosome rescue protein Dom34